jgi:hypothetical protein
MTRKKDRCEYIPKPPRICLWCGAPFTRNGAGRCCSMVCAFWSRVDKNGPTPEHMPHLGACWIWTGSAKNGYGQIGDSTGVYLTHRFSYALAHGHIPDELRVCHSCDNPPCCNPSHLFLGTQRDNMNDMKAKSRTPVGESRINSKLTKEQVLEIRACSEWPAATGRKFGICDSHVSKLRRRIRWAHVA